MLFINWYSLFFSKCERLPVSGHWPLFLFIMYTNYLDPGRKRGKKKDFKEIFKSFQPGSSLKDVEWWISIFPCTAHTINTFVIRFIVKPYKLLVLGKLSFRVSFCYNVFKRWFIEKKRKEILYKYNAKHYLLILGCSSSGFWWDCIQINTFLHMMCELSSFFPSLHGAYLFVSAQRKKKKKQHTGFMEIKKIKHALLPCIKNIDLVEFGHGFTRKICPNAVIFFRCILFTHKLFVTRLSKYL